MTPSLSLTAVIPAHNPNPGRLRRALLGLRAQTLPPGDWETLLIDNASARFPEADFISTCAPSACAIVREPALGLTAARRRAFFSARGALIVLIDDDNVLAPDYLARVVRLFAAHPGLGALGGRSLPEFETPPPSWAKEFFPLLALRDCGPVPLIGGLHRAPNGKHLIYPNWAPIGAGMGLRREAAVAWAERGVAGAFPDRRGSALTSSGDNDLILTLLRAGWEVGYFPELMLTHLIPATRLDAGYLARLNRGIQSSWMEVLSRHDANPWPSLTPIGASLRQIKAWFSHRAWRGPVERIRWQGACGHFAGRARQPVSRSPSS